MTDAVRLCALSGCTNVVEILPGAPTRKYCCARHRKLAWRQRLGDPAHVQGLPSAVEQSRSEPGASPVEPVNTPVPPQPRRLVPEPRSSQRRNSRRLRSLRDRHGPFGHRPWRRAPRRIWWCAAAAAVAAGGALLLAPTSAPTPPAGPTPATSSTDGATSVVDGADPSTGHCDKQSRSLTQATLHTITDAGVRPTGGAGPVLGTLYVRYSSPCHTVWARFDPTTALTRTARVTLTLIRRPDSTSYTTRVNDPRQHVRSNALLLEGAACAEATVTVTATPNQQALFAGTTCRPHPSNP